MYDLDDRSCNNAAGTLALTDAAASGIICFSGAAAGSAECGNNDPEAGKTGMMRSLAPSAPERVSENALQGVVISSGGTVIHSAESVQDVILKENIQDTLRVMNGGTAVQVTISSGCTMHISQGGTAKTICPVWNGELHISQGGYADDISASFNGRFIVSGGGSAGNAYLGYQAVGVVCSGGTLDNVQKGDGLLQISAGALVKNINTGNSLSVVIGGTVNRLTIGTKYSCSGTITIESTAVIDELIWTPGIGHVDISDDAVIKKHVNTYEGCYFAQGGQLLNQQLHMTGKTLGNGPDSDTPEKSKNTLYVMNGGVAGGTVISSGVASMTIKSGGTASDTFMSGGILRVCSGAIAKQTTVASKGKSPGGNGTAFVSRGGTMSGTTICSNGQAVISSGGICRTTTVKENGILTIRQGGILKDKLTTDGTAKIFADKGAEINFNINDHAPETLLIDDLSRINGFADANFTITVNGNQASGTYDLADSAAAFDRQISVKNTAGTKLGTLTIDQTLTVSEKKYTLAKNPGGRLYLVIGNVLKNITITPDTTAQTTSPVRLSFTLSGKAVSAQYSLDGKTWHVLPDRNMLEVSRNCTVWIRGLDSNGDVCEEGSCSVNNIVSAASSGTSSGGIISSGTISGGKAVYYRNGKVISSANYFSDVTVTAGEALHVSQGGVVDNSTIRKGGSIIISSGGKTRQITIASSGALHVYSGAAASGTIVQQSGYFGVGKGATTYDTTLDYAGKLTVWNGGTVISNTLYRYGSLILSSGANAKQSVINSGGGLHVYSGAKASGTIVKQGGFFGVGKGAATYSTTLDYAGKLTVWGGGKVIDNTIEKYGTIILSSGAAAEQSVINSQGGLHVYSGAAASGTTVKQGGFFGVGKGAIASKTLIDYAGKLTVWGGGVVIDNTIEKYGSLILSSGAAASQSIIKAQGGLHIYSGATAFDTTVTSGAHLGIGKGGTLKNAELQNGASMTFYTGAILAGNNTFAGTISIRGNITARGASINIDLSERKPGSTPMIDNISLLDMAGIFSLNVRKRQAYGTYILGGEAEFFNHSFSLMIDDLKCASLSPGASTVYDGITYQLQEKNKQLQLTISRT